MIINGYKHNAGKNAESTAIRNVLSFYRMELKEEVIFGLDGGFGFMFYQGKDDDLDILVGKNDIFPRRVFRLIGAKCEEYNSLSGSSGIKYINEKYLKNNVPVIARVDNGYLPYWNMPEEAHFGGHFVVLYGYDEEKDLVYLSDNQFLEAKVITFNEFSKARVSKKSTPINPNSLIYIVNKPVHIPDIGLVGAAALRPICRTFLAAPMNSIGLRGIKIFSNAMNNWVTTKKGYISETQKSGNTIKMPTLNFQVQQIGRYIEKYGTGGGCYRKMFSEYLNSLFVATNRNEFSETCKLISDSATKWTKIGDMFLKVSSESKISEIQDIITYASTQLLEIYSLEKSAFTILKKM